MTLTGEERGIRRNPCPSATRFRPTIFIIITVPVITFMHGNYSFIPETNHVSTVYSVAAVLYLQSVLHVMSFRPWIIIIIIIIIINIMNYYHHHHHHPCYHLYARYLQLYTWNKPRFYSIQCCSCSVCTVCATCNVISSVQYVPYFSFSTSRSLCAARNVAVLCSSLISPFPGTLLRYRLRDFETVPVATIITGITFGVAFQLRWTSIVRSLYFKILSASFLITFLSPEIATSVDMHVPFLWSLIMMCGLLSGIVLSVHSCWFMTRFEWFWYMVIPLFIIIIIIIIMC